MISLYMMLKMNHLLTSFPQLHSTLSLAAQCIVIGPVCLCVCVCVFVGLLPRQLGISCIDLHQTGSVGEGSDRLQLIKFWPSCTPGKGVCGGGILAPPYYSQRAVFASLLGAFFHYDCDTTIGLKPGKLHQTKPSRKCELFKERVKKSRRKYAHR